jgi:hypothetical protein
MEGTMIDELKFYWPMIFLILFVGAIIAFVVVMNEHNKRNCMQQCYPNHSSFKYRYKSSSDCYCKINGEWRIQLDEDKQ